MHIINKKLFDDLEKKNLINLNLGCGNQNFKNYYNCDIKEYKNVDIVCDLNKKLDMLPDNIVKNVYSNQTLEHILNLDGLIKELVRVSANNANFKFIVPHFANPYYYSDPTHVRTFGLFTFHYFITKEQQWIRKVPDYLSLNEIILVDVKIKFYRDSIFEHLINPFFEKIINLNRYFQNFYEKRLCWIYPPSNLEFEIKISK